MKITKAVTTLWYYWLILFVEGASLMVVELLGAKLLAPFYGSSLYVWTAVLSITIIGLTLGYHFGGKLTQKKALHYYLGLIILLAGLFILAMPATASFSIRITTGLGLIPGICFATSILLVPPMFLFGLVGPVSVSLISKNNKQKESAVGGIYFTSTIGGIAATFLFGYYLVPDEGLKFSSFITSIVLGCVALIYLLKLRFSQNNTESIEQLPLRLLNPIKEINTKTRSIYWFAAIEGATVMAIELISARMLAPYFGSSLFVWVTVIGITLLSLALGYFLAGRVSEKRTSLISLYWVLLTAAIFISFMHLTAAQFTLAFASMNLYAGIFLVALFLIFPPLVCLGMVPILLIKLTSSRANAGEVTSNVFAISSASGVFAMPIVGFIIIPALGLTNPSILIAIIVGAIPFFKLISQKKYIVFLFIIPFIISISARKIISTSDDVIVQYYSEGLLGQVLVADIFKNNAGQQVDNRLLFINRMGQTNVNSTSNATKWDYIFFSTAILSRLPEKSKALLLGLGGGSLANMMEDNLKMEVDAVELDERMLSIAQDYFSLTPNVNSIVDDARHYIETTTKKYDCIFFDVFKGDAMPSHVLSLECFKKAKSLLNQNGVLIVNFNGFLIGKTGRAGRSLYKTLLKSGFHVRVLPTPGREDDRNCLFVATEQSQTFSSNLRLPLLHEGKVVNIEDYFLDQSKIELKDAIIFIDDKSELDKLNMQANYIWRKGYNKSYANFFVNHGIPLFK